MLLLPTAEMREKALFWATQAKDIAPHYQHSEIGYNYRLSNVLAGIGVAQMQALPARIQRKRAIFEKWVEGLKGGGVEIVDFLNPIPPNFFHLSTSNYWLTVVLFESFEVREKVRLALEKEGVESRPIWKPLHLQPVFENVPYFGGRVGEELFERGLCLPSGTAMTDEELAFCCEVIEKAVFG